jgi:hypothetical protein
VYYDSQPGGAADHTARRDYFPPVAQGGAVEDGEDGNSESKTSLIGCLIRHDRENDSVGERKKGRRDQGEKSEE